MKVLWTKQAKFRLKEIYSFYKEEEGIEVAKYIKNKILDGAEKLKLKNIQRQEEDLLKPLNQQHRYLLEGHYKIVYLTKKQSILVTDVFDSRQDPDELIKRNI